MSKRTGATYSPEFRLEVAQEVVDKGRTIKNDSESLGLGKSSVDKVGKKSSKSYSVSRLCRVLAVNRSSCR